MYNRKDLISFLVVFGSVLVTGCTSPQPVRLLSRNLFDGLRAGGVSEWHALRDATLARIAHDAPDIVALQGLDADQTREVANALPDYGVVGVGAEDGRRDGRFVPLLYRQDRFIVLDAGHFWLSEEPSEPGSIGWDGTEPCVATWLRLKFKECPIGEVQIVNVQLDPDGRRARTESAKLLRRLVEAYGGRPIIIVGDFNCRPGSRPYRELTDDRGNLTALRDAHADGVADPRGKLRYDIGRDAWILYNRRFERVFGMPGVAESTGAGSGPVTATLRVSSALESAGFT